jgi:16S rRNA (uracil1498-N3)-methyltransferase
LREVLGAQTPPAFCVAVGPEGGWSEEDRHELRTRGFQSVGVGPFTLRTETAAVAGLAALRAWLP